MELKWMGQYRGFVQAVIRFSNCYAADYKTEKPLPGGISLCAAELQTLEYLLENEEKQDKMADVARRLGVTQSTFTRQAGKLVKLGLLGKYHRSNNKKEIVLVPTEKGKEVYAGYVRQAEGLWMNRLAELLEGVDPEALRQVTAGLDYIADMFHPSEPSGPQPLLPAD